jgi:hypothetical protein
MGESAATRLAVRMAVEMTSAETTALAEPPFSEAASAAVSDLQRACAVLLSAVGGGVSRAVDLERGLGLDKRLAWQVFRLARASEPLSEAANIPVSTSMRRLLAAAAKASVRADAISGVAAAFDRFEKFVGEHAGGRAEFVSTTRGLGHGADARAELNLRKALFRGNAEVWGVQAALLARTLIFHPSLSGPKGVQDSILIRGDVGLRRLRPGAPLTINAFERLDNEPVSAGAPTGDGVDWPGAPPPESRRIGTFEVLREFSTDPLPEMNSTKNEDGSFETELIFPPSGRKGAITLYAFQHTVGACSGEQSQNSSCFLVREPAEALMDEILVPTGWGDHGTARALVYGSRAMPERVGERRPKDLLPQRETAAHLGAFETSPPITGSPRHSEAVASVLRRVGWMGTKFDVYRCVVQYPILHTLLRVAVDALSAGR